jgi:hypothetical protein
VIAEHDQIILASDLPAEKLRAGDIGTDMKSSLSN